MGKKSAKKSGKISGKKSRKMTARAGETGGQTTEAMERFALRLRAQIGEEAFAAFLRTREEEPLRGIRANTGKITPEALLPFLPFDRDEVPWCPEGFYVPEGITPSALPAYQAGLFYIQEPSAMLPAALLPVKEGDAVLDLCAAPGGKSVALAAKAGEKGFLVSNDISAARARALVKNLEMEGFTNFCVTAEAPARLRAAFGRVFDAVLVDAPCSGEGMFRRDPALKKSWAARGPEDYSPLQLEILLEAEKMLKPGGYLLYSTCTFSAEEDEQVIGRFLAACPRMEIVSVPRAEGFAPGMGEGFADCVRIWPHIARGEGHFAALMRSRAGQDSGISGTGTVQENAAAGEIPVITGDPDAQRRRLAPGADAFFSLIGAPRFKRLFPRIYEEKVLLVGRQLPHELRYLRTGLLAGTEKDGKFVPSAALARALRKEEYACSVDLEPDDPAVIRYLRGETLTADHIGDRAAHVPAGAWALVCMGGYPLGWALAVEGTLRNKYPAAWRMV